MTSETDADLILKVRDRDMEAFGQLWKRHIGSARAVANTVVSPSCVDDLVSDAYLNMLNAIFNGKGPVDGFSQYLHSTIYNLAKRHGIRSKEIAVESDSLVESRQHPSKNNDLSYDLEQSEDKNIASAAFHALNRRHRIAIWLSQVEGLPAKEIAEHLGVSVNAVYVIISRGKSRLKEIYQELSSAQSDGDFKADSKLVVGGAGQQPGSEKSRKPKDKPAGSNDGSGDRPGRTVSFYRHCEVAKAIQLAIFFGCFCASCLANM